MLEIWKTKAAAQLRNSDSPAALLWNVRFYWTLDDFLNWPGHENSDKLVLEQILTYFLQNPDATTQQAASVLNVDYVLIEWSKAVWEWRLMLLDTRLYGIRAVVAHIIMDFPNLLVDRRRLAKIIGADETSIGRIIKELNRINATTGSLHAHRQDQNIYGKRALVLHCIQDHPDFTCADISYEIDSNLVMVSRLKSRLRGLGYLAPGK